MSKWVVVTGTNKGIGLAIVARILREQRDISVFAGSRDTGRGQAAVRNLVQENPDWASRVTALTIDVSDRISVQAAASTVAATSGCTLVGLINNAGVASGSMSDVLNVNVWGIHRVCQAFLPLLSPGSAIVNVSSASGPMYLAKADDAVRGLLTNKDVTWEQIEKLMEDKKAVYGEKIFNLGEGESYGFSKACVNAYTRFLARTHPGLNINACTPGFILTDLTQPYVDSQGSSAAKLGMKTPDQGAIVPVQLLLSAPGSGNYYGSDGLRSPLTVYRGPGDPEFTDEY